MDTTKTDMKRVVLSGLIVLASAVGVAAQTEADAAYKRIAMAPYFAVGGIGFTGAITPAEKDVHILIRNKDDKKLVALTEEKNPAAQMYGLLGLRYLSHARYEQIAGSLAKSPRTVETFSGCLRGSESVAKVSATIAKGDYNKALKHDMERQKK